MKTVISSLIVLFMLFASAESRAADCKMQWDATDYRSGERVLWTRWQRNRMILISPYASIAGVSEGDRKFLGIQLVESDRGTSTRPTKADLDAAMVIPEGAKLRVQMADGSIVELYAEKEVIGDTSFAVNAVDSYTYRSHAVIRYSLNAEAMAALTAQQAVNFNVELVGRSIDISFGKKPTDKIQEVLACVR